MAKFKNSHKSESFTAAGPCISPLTDLEFHHLLKMHSFLLMTVLVLEDIAAAADDDHGDDVHEDIKCKLF